jgi:hypothetical protein
MADRAECQLSEAALGIVFGQLGGILWVFEVGILWW